MSKPSWREVIRIIGGTTVLAVALVAGVAGPSLVRALKSEAPATEAWFIGPASARWLITEYADLECPYCRVYTPELKQWVSQQPDVKLKWHHFPLQEHGFAAEREARLVECAGQLGGAEAFWTAIDQVLLHSRGNGQGLTAKIEVGTIPSDTLSTCADTDRVVASQVFQQRSDAQRRGILATPTLEITDTLTGHSVRLEGAVDEVTLLSAMDGLAAQAGSQAEPAL